MEALKKALGKIRGGRNEVAQRLDVKPVNLDRGLAGEVKKNEHYLEETKKFILETINELQELLRQAA